MIGPKFGGIQPTLIASKLQQKILLSSNSHSVASLRFFLLNFSDLTIDKLDYDFIKSLATESNDYVSQTL